MDDLVRFYGSWAQRSYFLAGKKEWFAKEKYKMRMNLRSSNTHPLSFLQMQTEGMFLCSYAPQPGRPNTSVSSECSRKEAGWPRSPTSQLSGGQKDTRTWLLLLPLIAANDPCVQSRPSYMPANSHIHHISCAQLPPCGGWERAGFWALQVPFPAPCADMVKRLLHHSL